MSVEELLKPRYKVIAEDTSGNWTKDSLITFEDDFLLRPIYYLYDNQGRQGYAPSFFDGFPHLFKKLEWYEDREVSEMPEYVKDENGQVFKIREWDGTRVPHIFVNAKVHTGFIESCTESVLYPMYYPSTKEEYDSYIKLKK